MSDLNLLPYDLVSAEAKRNLLLGNGFSFGLHAGFRYGSLQQTAEDAGLIGPALRALFERLGTSDFERVLARLVEAQEVNAAYGIDVAQLKQGYDTTKNALLAAVKATHPERRQLDRARLEAYRPELRRFERIFTTNYDLLLYWIAALESGGEKSFYGFSDFFWGADGAFDPADTESAPGWTRLYYLHGALFLSRKDDQTRKVRRQGSTSLLALLRDSLDGAAPVFVSEGDATAKRRSIAQNEYLEWAYRQLETLSEGITVFGHSLSDQDGHILGALCRGCQGPIAVGLYGEPAKQRQDAAELRARCLAHQREESIVFFDAATFPLLRPAGEPA